MLGAWILLYTRVNITVLTNIPLLGDSAIYAGQG